MEAENYVNNTCVETSPSAEALTKVYELLGNWKLEALQPVFWGKSFMPFRYKCNT